MIPASETARDYMLNQEVLNQELLETFSAGSTYGNDLVIQSESNRVMADLMGDPAASWLTAVTGVGQPVSGEAQPQWAEIEQVLRQHPETLPLIEAAADKPTPDVPVGYTVGQMVAPIGEGVSRGLAGVTGGVGRILTLVVLGIAGLAVLAATR